MTDPVEETIAEALDAAGIAYERDKLQLDFYVPAFGVFIECKRMHTPRISEQMTRAQEIIVVQGMHAARTLAALIRSSRHRRQ